MDQRTIQIFFTLVRSAICGTRLSDDERGIFTYDSIPELLKLASKHDIAHLLTWGLKQNDLLCDEHKTAEKYILKSVYRYECLKYEYENICVALEKAKIPFMPLKGSVLRKYYPEPWMRTSCDIDILVHSEDLDRAISYLIDNMQYTEKERATHDVSLFSPSGVHIELHFDLVEEGRANKAINVLNTVWDNAFLHKNTEYWYEMRDDFFYFYHIAHMAKHFESGGCGIRPIIDLWLLDRIDGIDVSARNELLAQGDLLRFADSARILSEIWLEGKPYDELSGLLQDFILQGSVYGSTDNRVALQQKKTGGRFGYLLSRVFIPYVKLKRYYPILEKHRWLMPFMQVRRWFMLLDPSVAKMAKRELEANKNLSKIEADDMSAFLENIGL